VKVLATGAGGFVVGAFVRRLLRRDPACLVMAVDLGGGDVADTGDVRVLSERVDVTDRRRVSQVITEFGPDVVVHGAALTVAGGDEYAAGGRYLETNVGGALNVAVAACDCATVRRLVHLSTGSVYGLQDSPVLHPGSSPTRPRDYYGITKLAGELLARRTCELRDVPFVSLRLSNVFGADERPNPLRVLASLPTQAAWARRQGTRPRVTEDTLAASSDWISSFDVGEAVVAACGPELTGSHTYNVASGQVTSVSDVCRMLGLDVDVVPPGTTLDVGAGDLVGGGMNAADYDIRATTQSLGWRPRPFADQISELLDWCERKGVSPDP
jgi:dTDP-glucose 4,6-dehydratase